MHRISTVPSTPRRRSAAAVLYALLLCSSPQVAQADTARNDADNLAQALVRQLTPDEKFSQLLNVAPAIPRLRIPAYNWWTESLHGAMGPVPTTNFPEPIGLAATFDRPLMHEVAGAISLEVRALHTLARSTGRLGRIGSGLNTWSPNINIFRDPRWGRGQETYGEDPYLTGELGVAFIRGIQGPNPDLPHVVATPKHFAVHSGPESTRHFANVFTSAHDLEDTYLPAFRAAIVDAKAGSIMCAYNRVNGEPACGTKAATRRDDDGRPAGLAGRGQERRQGGDRDVAGKYAAILAMPAFRCGGAGQGAGREDDRVGLLRRGDRRHAVVLRQRRGSEHPGGQQPCSDTRRRARCRPAVNIRNSMCHSCLLLFSGPGSAGWTAKIAQTFMLCPC